MSRRFLTSGARFLSTPLLTPLVLGLFLLLYLGIAFRSDDALAVLMELVRSNRLLWGILALIPLNAAARLMREMRRQLSDSSAARTGIVPLRAPDEEVRLEGTFNLKALSHRLHSAGYRTRCLDTSLTAERGVGLFPARILLFASLFCISGGILLSITTRNVRREAVIEGERLPFSDGQVVGSITLSKIRGWLFDRDLAIRVGTSGSEGDHTFRLYPPGVNKGYFVYPRYLGIAPLIRFSAPDLCKLVETHFILMIYPPGKEDSADIAGSPYRIYFTLAPPQGGEDDPYRSGRFVLQFSLFTGEQKILSGSVTPGGVFVHDGYRIEFPEFRRVVATDFVQDFGIPLIWLGILSAGTAVVFLVPVKLFFPRREMRFMVDHDVLRAFSRAEGQWRSHGEIFHQALDFLVNAESPIARSVVHQSNAWI